MHKLKQEKKKIITYLEMIGKNIKDQREVVFCESYVDFAARVSQVSGMLVSPDIIKAIESADPVVLIPMNVYMAIFIIMGVDAQVLQSTKNATLLYLASVESPVGIEKKLVEIHKKTKDQD